MKKIFGFILSLVLLISAFPLEAENSRMPFEDVSSKDWYYDSVYFCYERELVNGVDVNSFAPEKDMTRADLVTLLYRTAGIEPGNYASSAAEHFIDVEDDKWYSEYVGWAAEKGLANGYDDGSFKPNQPVSREELATFLVRFLSAQNLEMKDSNPVAAYNDSDEVAEWAEKDVEAIRLTGLMKGDDAGNINPQSSTRRAEIATIIERLITFIDSQPLNLTVDGTFMSAGDFVAWLSEKLHVGNVGADNYYEVKSTAESLAPGEEKTIAVKFGVRSFTLKLRRAELDIEAFLAEDGEKFNYTYAGELSSDKLAVWLKSMADETDSFENAEVTSLDVNEDKASVTVKFDASGKSVTRKYEVKLTKGQKDSDPRQIIFVSADGNDSASGAKNDPLKTFDGARKLVREKKANIDAPINVYFLAGDYYLTNTVAFDAEDSGSETAPIKYAAYRGDVVNFYGGTKVDPSRITKADEEFASKLFDETAAKKLLKVDVSGLIDELPDILEIGTTSVYINGTPLTTARFPNKSDGSDQYLYTSGFAHENNPDGTKKIHMLDFDKSKREYVKERANQWSDESINNLYTFGYFAWDWYNAYFKVLSFDLNDHFGFGSMDIPMNDPYLPDIFGNDSRQFRYYLLNIPEEIDAPGESYTDVANKVIYFYPPENFSYDGMFIPNVDKLLTINGAENLTFEGINLEYATGNIIEADSVKNIEIKDCVIAHSNGSGMDLDGIGITVSGCEIYDFVEWCILISGGDRNTLTSGESVIENCRIHDNARNEEEYRYAIQAESLGLEIRHNEIYNCPGNAVGIRTNDVHVTYNEFHHCITNMGDLGVVTWGRDVTLLGMEVNYNYFHDIGNEFKTSHGQKMIYIDDGSMGPEIHGNVFVRSKGDLSSAVNANGSQFLNITGNVFVDVASAFTINNWSFNNDSNQDEWLYALYSQDAEEHRNILNVEFDSQIWRDRYKGTIWENIYRFVDKERLEEYSKLSDDELKTRLHNMGYNGSNVLNSNVFVNVGKDEKGNPYKTSNNAPCECKNNFDSTDTSIFESYDNDNFALSSSGLSKVRQVIPGFENIPFDQIGVVE